MAPVEVRGLKAAIEHAGFKKCQQKCPGGRRCILSALVPHRWHNCSNPDCYCHTPERYGRRSWVEAERQYSTAGRAERATQEKYGQLPCRCPCHEYPGAYPTSTEKPCVVCGHVNEDGALHPSSRIRRRGWRPN